MNPDEKQARLCSKRLGSRQPFKLVHVLTALTLEQRAFMPIFAELDRTFKYPLRWLSSWKRNIQIDEIGEGGVMLAED